MKKVHSFSYIYEPPTARKISRFKEKVTTTWYTLFSYTIDLLFTPPFPLLWTLKEQQHEEVNYDLAPSPLSFYRSRRDQPLFHYQLPIVLRHNRSHCLLLLHLPLIGHGKVNLLFSYTIDPLVHPLIRLSFIGHGKVNHCSIYSSLLFSYTIEPLFKPPPPRGAQTKLR